MVRLTLIIILVTLQAVFGPPAFLLGDGCYCLRAAAYPFFHANWWHLAVNAAAIWAVFAPQRKVTAGQMAAAALISFIVYPLSFIPVIGFSNVIYAMIGLRTPPLSNPWWRQPAVIAFLAVTIVMVFIPRISATTHIAAFLLGMGGAAAGRWWKHATRDARRYL